MVYKLSDHLYVVFHERNSIVGTLRRVLLVALILFLVLKTHAFSQQNVCSNETTRHEYRICKLTYYQ